MAIDQIIGTSATIEITATARHKATGRKQERRAMRKLLFALFCLASFTSCQIDEAYFRYEVIKDGKWSASQSFVFDLDTTSIQVGVPYDITLEVTNNAQYPYQNIWLFVMDNFDDPTTFTKKSKEYLLANEFGEWYGSGFASTFQLSLALQKKVVFTEKRNYRIMIGHGMRDEELLGIEKIGVRVRPAQPE